MEFERECETKVTEPLCDYSNHISWFRLQDCFTRLGANCCDYSPVYCWGNIEILLFTFCYSIVLSFLLYFHFSKHSPKQWKTWTKEKTWIFLLAVPVELFVFIRYLWNKQPDWIAWCITFLPSFGVSYVFFFICFYFVRKAANLLDNNERIMRFLKIMMAFACIMYVVAPIVEVFVRPNNDTVDCKTIYFVIPQTFRLLYTFVFTLVGIWITIAVNRSIDNNREMYEGNDDVKI